MDDNVQKTIIQKAINSSMHKAISLLAIREHSAVELLTKLTQKGIDENIADIVLQQLQEQGLQSDSRFIESFVNERIRRGYGPIKIQYQLLQKGIANELISEYVNIDQELWLEKAQIQYQKKYKDTCATDYKEWGKRARFLQGRGFTSEQIRHSIIMQQDID